MIKSFKRIKTLKDAVMRHDGGAITFDIEATDGTAAAYELLVDDFPAFVQFLSGCVLEAAGKRSDYQPTDLRFRDKNKDFFPIETTQIGVGAHIDPGKAVLVMRLYDVDLAFEVHSEGARRLIGDTGNIVPL